MLALDQKVMRTGAIGSDLHNLLLPGYHCRQEEMGKGQLHPIEHDSMGPCERQQLQYLCIIAVAVRNMKANAGM